MTKIDIVSGFLGAGKTTLIKKMLKEGFLGEKVVLIENEYGEIGIDGRLFKDFEIEVKEMYAGCICCTIAGDFTMALKEVIKLYEPDRVIIEPSGVGKLSDVVKACGQFVSKGQCDINMRITVVDGTKYKMYLKNFAEFYRDQLIHSNTIFISRTQNMKKDSINSILKDMRLYNKKGTIVSTDWDILSGSQVIEMSEKKERTELLDELKTAECSSRIRRITEPVTVSQVNKTSGHHADEIFKVWGVETANVFDKKHLYKILQELQNQPGFILRAKGILEVEERKWVQFDYVPDEITIRDIAPDYTGRICVIGENMNEDELTKLFGVMS
ncbi:GTP-binding protein [Anaerocolumna cellulosilytica]|uniref:GTP-binding protein n=1 Tax=Anaerocolumna cellulosilytica TaxID=433286 RepID=A0A6S6R3V9_9FIRM|nr:GTP-binding protein [Anaerocolumna cellulosilytica]MBB5195114.1 G3E family GTPase [Anaerocolumna cellulosilytica]BCJ96049.1 GTP-binding protein [Anaerocolumna cellulosilytica]